MLYWDILLMIIRRRLRQYTLYRLYNCRHLNQDQIRRYQRGFSSSAKLCHFTMVRSWWDVWLGFPPSTPPGQTLYSDRIFIRKVPVGLDLDRANRLQRQFGIFEFFIWIFLDQDLIVLPLLQLSESETLTDVIVFWRKEFRTLECYHCI